MVDVKTREKACYDAGLGTAESSSRIKKRLHFLC